MIQINQVKVNIDDTIDDLTKKVAKILSVKSQDILDIQIQRKSLDARKKSELFFVLTVFVRLKKEEQILKKLPMKNIMKAEQREYTFPFNAQDIKHHPVVIGAGPSGLVCAYYLSVAGFKPILLERGEDVEKRYLTVTAFWKDGILNPESNVQFGEGGAGTFSDGKLNTLNKDPFLRNKEILKLFVKMGADASLLYEQKPHVGTDKLMEIVKNIRNAIIQNGGEVRFSSKVTDFHWEKANDGAYLLNGITVNHREFISCKYAVLAIGHSARDTFLKLHEKNLPLEAKSFAMGFRVEHLQNMINETQLGTASPNEIGLGAATYKLTTKAKNGRGVYSFCMCPGGYIVNASSEPKRLTVNGMSYSRRDGKNANSAIIVSVTPEDFPGESPLRGVLFQQEMEERAFSAGNGKIPIQLYRDFKCDKLSKEFGDYQTETKGAYTFANIRHILPEYINEAFIDGMEQFGRKIKGFSADDVIVAGIETRTSSPVRIQRDETCQSIGVKGLYPCGEGAGYAGGIVSAASDGLKIAEKIAENTLKGA